MHVRKKQEKHDGANNKADGMAAVRWGGSVFGRKRRVGAKSCCCRNALAKMACSPLTAQGKCQTVLNNRVGMSCCRE